MFNRIPISTPAEVEQILGNEPAEIAEWLADEWRNRRSLTGVASATAAGGGTAVFALATQKPVGLYDHLIYAALLEMAGAERIMRRVLFEAAHGERLGTITRNLTYSWLTTTEELFFSFGLPFSPVSTVSQIRPTEVSTRFNAYYRDFGEPLVPGGLDGGYVFERAAIANLDFVPTFTSFLTEFWQAYLNTKNVVGPNPSDLGAIATISRRLRTMLNERRGGSNVSQALDRQEFSAVAEMSWFHFVLQSNNPVLEDLDATGSDAAARLERLGARVGVTPHPRATGLFVLAPLMSKLLIAIEAGLFDTAGGVASLFAPARVEEMLEIVNHWEIVSGVRTKSTPVLAGGAGAPSTAPSLLASR